MSLLEWWNFIFLLPLVSGLIIGVGIAATGAVADLGDADLGDADADMGEADMGDVDADVDMGDVAVGDVAMADADVGDADIGDADMGSADIGIDIGDADADADADGDNSNIFAQALSFFGLGQGVPMSVMLPILLIVNGASGLLINQLLEPWLKLPLLFFPFALGVSFFLTAFLGQSLANLLRRVLKGKASSIGSSGLVGATGKAVYAINEQSGVAHVKDPFGNIHRISCHSDIPIASGTPLVVLRYHEGSKRYLVEPMELELDL